MNPCMTKGWVVGGGPIMGGVALFVPIMGGMALCATGRAMWLNFGFLEKDSSWFRLQSLRKHQLNQLRHEK